MKKTLSYILTFSLVLSLFMPFTLIGVSAETETVEPITEEPIMDTEELDQPDDLEKAVEDVGSPEETLLTDAIRQFNDPIVYGGESYPESAHPYSNNADLTYSYTYPEEADYLEITFSDDTNTEGGCDYLYILDSSGKQVGQYSGNQLSGKSVKVAGNSFSIRFISDGSITKYGFKVVSVEKYVPLIENGFIYEIQDETAVVTGYTGSDTDLVIPSTLGGYPVAGFAQETFQNAANITSITIPDSVTSIEYEAFRDCKSLNSVIIGNGVTSIGYDAFCNCTSLNSVTIGNSVTSIGSYAFQNCTSLSSIEIPDSVTNIGYGAFYNCTSLSSIDIPGGVTSIGDGAFQNCTSLSSVTIPASVTSIGYGAFYNCTSLSSIDVSAANASYSSADGVLFNKNQTSLITCPAGKSGSYTIPDSVTSIGNSAFYNCTSLNSVIIGNGVTSIGSYAFQDCTSLTSIIIPDSVTNIGYGAFYNCTSLNSVIIGNGVTSIGSYAFYNCTSLSSINVSASNASYSSADGILFNKDQTKLILYPGGKADVSYTVPDTVSEIANNAFQSARFNLLTFGSGITAIGNSAFSEIPYLNYLVLPEEVTSVGAYAFANCWNLRSVWIYGSPEFGDAPFSYHSLSVFGTEGSSVETMAAENGYTFYLLGTEYQYTVLSGEVRIDRYLGMAAEAEIPAEIEGVPVTSIGDYAFSGCTSLTSITIPDGVTSIGDYAFSGCTSLTSITIPDSVTSIGNYAFYRCTSFNSIEIPDNVTSIGSSAFCNCTSLSSVTIGNGVTSIGWGTFDGCTSLSSVTIGNGVTSISYDAFYNCTSLGSINVSASNANYSSADGVLFNKNQTGLITCPAGKSGSYTIPDSVTSIGSYAFRDCTNLNSVTIGNGVTRIGDYAFYNCTSLSSITIGNGVTSIGYNAFQNCTSLSSIDVSASNANYSSADGVLFNKDQSGLITCPAVKSGSYTIPDSVTRIGYGAFYNCTSLSSIEIPDSVTSIGDCAFDWCTSLTSITIPDSVTSIGEGAFYNCTNLTSITIPNGVTSIGWGTFDGCTSLSSIEIPDSVTSIGSQAFSNCTNLTSITIPNGVTSIGNYAFQNCTSLSSVAIPASVTSIGNYAFYNCTNLSSVTISARVTSIGDYAFYQCYSLNAATIYGSPSINSESFGEGTCLYGYAGSSVEEYANDRGLTFVPLSPHTHLALETPFADGDNGHSYVCSICGERMGEGLTEHSYGEWQIENFDASTCRVRICSECGYRQSSVFINASALDHQISVTWERHPDVTSYDWGYRIYLINRSTGTEEVRNYSYYSTSCYFYDLPNGSYEAYVVLVKNDEEIAESNHVELTIPGEANVPVIAASADLTSITVTWDEIGPAWEILLYLAQQNGDSLENKYSASASPRAGSYTFENVAEGDYLAYAISLPSGSQTRSNYVPVSIKYWQSGDYKYVISGEGAVVTGYTGSDEDLVIPSSIDGYPVTGIMSGVFEGCETLNSVTIPNTISQIAYKAFYGTGIRSVSIPDSVTSIGDFAFAECENLTSVAVPDSVTNIGEGAFYHCKALSTATIGNGVLTIPWRAFYGCESLSSILLSDTLKRIYEEAFYGCSALSSITLPDSLEDIYRYGFTNCTSLSSITIPENVYGIDKEAFFGCSALVSIGVSENNTTFSSIEGVLFDKEGTTLIFYPPAKGSSYTVPDGVTSIEYYAFFNCKALSSVQLPDSVQEIGYSAFRGSGLASIEIPDSVTSIDDNAFYGCTNLSSVTIPNSVDYFGSDIFSGCTGLSSANLEEGLTEVPDSAFSGCKSLEEFRIPVSVSDIAYFAFGGSGLRTVTIPDSVISIRGRAFYNCDELTSVEIGAGVTDIRSQAFADCDRLTAINVSEDNEYYSSLNGVLFDKARTSILQVPGGLSGEYEVPDGVTILGDNVFQGCRGLTSIQLPDSVQGIDSGAFSGSGITSISIPDSVTSIGQSAFSGCTSLSSVTIGNGVTSIGYGTFYGSGLKSVEIPENVTRIDYEAFNGCANLKTVTIYGSPVIMPEVFPNNVTLVGVPGSSVEIYANNYGYRFRSLDDDIAYGDVDGSGVIDISDVMLLAKSVAGWILGNEYYGENADCYGDGVIDISDVMQLAKFVAGWNIDLGPAALDPGPQPQTDSHSVVIVVQTG